MIFMKPYPGCEVSKSACNRSQATLATLSEKCWQVVISFFRPNTSYIQIFSGQKYVFKLTSSQKKHSPLFAFVLSRIPSTEEPLSLTSMSASSVSNTRINNYPKTYRSSTILWPPCFLFIPTFKSSPTQRWSGTRASPLDNGPTSQCLDWSQFSPPNAKS